MVPMNPKLRIKLASYIYLISQDRTVEEMVKELIQDQEAAEPDRASREGMKFYEDLLKSLKPEKAPNIEYFQFLDEDELPKLGKK